MAEISNPTFDETYRRVFPMVLSKCRRMMPDAVEAQDLAQEVLVRLWRARAPIVEPRALTAWLYRTCTRLAIDRARARDRGRRAAALLAMVGGADATATDGERRNESRDALANVLAETPARELEAVLLCRVDGLGHVEIAEVMGIGERTVRRLLDRFARRQGERMPAT